MEKKPEDLLKKYNKKFFSKLWKVTNPQVKINP